jgi:hypothetical protein
LERITGGRRGDRASIEDKQKWKINRGKKKGRKYVLIVFLCNETAEVFLVTN